MARFYFKVITLMFCLGCLSLFARFLFNQFYIHDKTLINGEVSEKKPAEEGYDACNINCHTGIPCEYNDELDFRIIVLTYNRPNSLKKCLNRIKNIDTLGDNIGVDIWIDKSKNGQIDSKTVNVSVEFKSIFKQGKVCVHKQEHHAYIIGQWIDTWRPKYGSKEIALIVEDDIDISPFSYKWLKAVHKHYGNWSEIAGYTLQLENVKFIRGMKPAAGPKTQPVFLYGLFGTWGYSPKASLWSKFQDWFHEMRKNPEFHPYVPNTGIHHWYTSFEKKGTADSMWEMWLIYYIHNNSLFSVFSNLEKYTGKKDVHLEHNRREAGLHYGKGREQNSDNSLLTYWNKSFVNFPSKHNATYYGLDGKII